MLYHVHADCLKDHLDVSEMPLALLNSKEEVSLAVSVDAAVAEVGHAL